MSATHAVLANRDWGCGAIYGVVTVCGRERGSGSASNEVLANHLEEAIGVLDG